MYLFYVLVIVAAVAVATAAYAAIVESRRKAVMRRVIATAEVPLRPAPLKKTASTPKHRAVLRSIASVVPTAWLTDMDLKTRLVRAGFEQVEAPQVFAAARVGLLVGLPLLAIVAQVGRPMTETVVYVVLAFILAWMLPNGYLARRIRLRQRKLRNAIPDTLDLLIVCVEAGVSLDSAMMRVSKEIGRVHPELAYEFSVVLSKIKAGMPREEAMRELFRRTGLEELRTFVANIVQSERWGTSIARVLRVAAETLRRKRRQAAEKRATTAPVRMALPLVLLILPPLFIVVLGPSVMQLLSALRGT
jgi:tight adherence protein C